MSAITPLLGPGAGDLLFMLAAILALDVAAGVAGLGPRIPFGPAAAGTALARAARRRLDRAERSPANRIIRGAIVAAVAIAIAIVLGWGLERAARTLPYGQLVEGLAVFLVLGQRAALARLARARRALVTEDLDGARRALAGGGSDPGDGADRYTLARLAVEGATRAFAFRVAGAVFWYLLAGLAGLLVQSAANGLASALGRNRARCGEFALAAERLDAVLGYLPDRIAAFILVLASLFVPGASPLGSVRLTLGGGGRAAAAAGCLSLAPLAGALALALGGPGRGRSRETPWIGDGRARAGTSDMRRATYLLGVAGLISVGAVAGVLLAVTR